MKNYSNDSIHNHTVNSIGDGCTTIEELVDVSIENGATSVAITDHGVCSGWLDFFNYAKKKGIKPILGVEAYMPEHILILAKDYLGFQAISRFISESNRHLSEKGKPVGDEEMIRKFFGENSDGYGHVVVTSACIGGIIAKSLMFNYSLEKEIRKIKKRMDAVEFPEGYKEAAAMVTKLTKRQEQIKSDIANTRVIASKKFKKTELSINKMEDSDKKVLLQKALEAEKQETENAKARLDVLKEELKNISAEIKPYKEIVNAGKTKKQRIEAYEKQILEIREQTKPDQVAMDEAKKAASLYQSIIYPGDFYMEVQYHGIDKEEYIYPRLAKIARELNIPIVAANDSHFARKNDIAKRVNIQNMKYITNAKEWKPASTGDDEMYIKTGSELAEILSKILPEDIVDEAMSNIQVITSQCNLELSDEKHYPKFENAKELLRKKCLEGIPKRYPNGMPKAYYKQMEYELDIIDKMGFNDYFCEVADFIEYCESQADNSVEIGPGRGSGAGSIVCYLSGITKLDPMTYNLMFERFLNPNRVTMPDIDTDFSAHAREIGIKYVKEKYGERSVAGIMTKNKMGPKSALDYSGKLYGLEFFGDKGKYTSLVKEIKALIPNEPNATIAKSEDAIRMQFAKNSDALNILDRAKLLEGLIVSYGTHAAGIIIGDGTDLENYIPLMVTTDDDGNAAWVIQADMNQAEAQLGFIKMDFLGLKNLNIITDAMRLITKEHGVKIDPYNLPFEDEVFEKIYQTGFTNYVFQVESKGMKGMLKDFKPTCFEDIIILVAMYRPGPMDFIPDVIKVKNGKKKMTFLCPQLEPILGKTYGAIVYQEQIIEIFRSLAGYSMADADNVRRYMSKKKTEAFEAERKPFIYGDPDRNICGCVANGISAEIANTIFDQMVEFSKYAFNKSHAAAYALVSYITAWLKLHYFKEYVCAAIKTQPDKVVQLAEDCKQMNVAIYKPDINKSYEDFTLYKDGIIFGLKGIKGLKSAASEIIKEREENGVFVSPEDFIVRVKPESDVLENLVLAGAFDSFTNNRDEMAKYLATYKAKFIALEKANEKCKLANEATSSDEKEAKKLKAAAQKADESAKVAMRELLDVNHKKCAEMLMTDRLAYEMEYLGIWLSGNPMDDYVFSGKGYVEIASLSPCKSATVAGVITSVRKVNRKSDGAPMAFFTLADKSGNVLNVACFAQSYAQYKDHVSEGNVIIVSGNVQDDGEELTLCVKTITKPAAQKRTILFSVKTFSEMLWLLEVLKSNHDNDGYNFKIYNEQFGEFRDGSFSINEEVLERKAIRAEFIKAA